MAEERRDLRRAGGVEQVGQPPAVPRRPAVRVGVGRDVAAQALGRGGLERVHAPPVAPPQEPGGVEEAVERLAGLAGVVGGDHERVVPGVTQARVQRVDQVHRRVDDRAPDVVRAQELGRVVGRLPGQEPSDRRRVGHRSAPMLTIRSRRGRTGR